ncbi:MAG TPA: ABC transporter permease [Aldersonia sp.]
MTGGGRVDAGIEATLLLGRREIRSTLRAPEVFVPNLLIPVAWFFIMTASLDTVATRGGLADWAGFQLPVAVVFATMSGSAGLNLVTDIERGYFDKLLLTPVSRAAILVGAMAGDLLRILVQATLVVGLAMASGVDVATGALGAAVVVLVAALWGAAFSAIGFAVAIRTGSPQAMQAVWALFVPLLFMTTTFAPLEAMAGWLRVVASLNPVTYILDGLRALTITGWELDRLIWALITTGAVGAVTFGLAFAALRRRID